MMSIVVVLGASPNPDRYSYKAVKRLVSNNHQVVAIGKRKGFIGDIPIITGQPEIKDVHTVLMYLAPYHQGEIFDYVISLKPKRVVFNPGTESPEFEEWLESYDIKVVHDCSLLMMASGRF
jgi:predicted CoA-binding protein